jgi:hypothetical protein
MNPARIAVVTFAVLVVLALTALIVFGPVQLIVYGRDIGAELAGLASMSTADRIGLAIGLWISIAIFASVALAALPFALTQGLVVAAVALAFMLLVLGLSALTALLMLAPMVGLVALVTWAARRVKARIERRGNP